MWKTRLSAWADGDRLHQYEDKVLLLLTLIIGVVVGLVIAAFIYVTESLGSRMYPADGAAWRRLVMPIAGALFTGYLLTRYFPNARGSGIPQTKAALFLHDGLISLRTVFGKFFCSSVSLASGIALGREGPSVHIGAGLASVLGRRLGLGPTRIRALVPIGASAALAAAFNTPVAAVLFSLEEVMGDMHAPVLGSIVLSSATSWIVVHLLLGDEPLFHVPAYQLVSPVEFLSYAVLGVVGGLVSVCFVKLLLFLRKFFAGLPKWSAWLQPAAGGLLVGAMGWFVPAVMGVGYGHVSEALNGQMALPMMALLVVLKLVATATCYGSGNAGGIFGPSLFIGAMMGGAVGSAAHMLAPDYTGSVGAYALVGMGAAFAGMVRVPLTSVIMIFEMTRDYSIIVPLMISNLISFYISHRLQEEPIYEALQHQDGLHLPSGLKYRQNLLIVRQAMREPAQTLSAVSRIEDALAILDADHNASPVMDGKQLLGMVSLAAVKQELERGNGAEPVTQMVGIPAPDAAPKSEEFPHLHLDHPLDVALRRMAKSKWNVLPVVSRSDMRDLKGIISLKDILRAYGIAEEAAPDPPQREEISTSRGFIPGVMAVAMAIMILLAFLNYYYRTERGLRADTAFKQGNQLVQQEQYESAVERFRDALSSSPGNAQYRLALGMALTKSGHLEEAKVYLKELLRRNPQDGGANMELARIAATESNTAEAVLYFNRAAYANWATDRDQNRLRAHLELADYLGKSGSKPRAIAELLAAAAQVKGNDSAKKTIAQRLLSYQANREAADVFAALLNSSPDDATSYAGLGDAKFALQDYPAAQEAFQNAVQLDPSDQSSAKKLELCERILALDPEAHGLTAVEREKRAKTLLAAAVACANNTELAAKARKALNGRPGLLDTVDLAWEVWKSRQNSCSGPQAPDEAAQRALQRLARR